MSKTKIGFALTGSFCIPDRSDFYNEYKFAFALDEKGIVFIDDSGKASQIVKKIKNTKTYILQ